MQYIMEKLTNKDYSIVGGYMNSLKVKFGKRIKEIRKSKGITQEQLAELIDIEPPNISKIECGMHFPQPDKIEKIAKIFDISVKDLFDFEHFQKKQDLILFITSALEEFDLSRIELIYKFVYNLKLFK